MLETKSQLIVGALLASSVLSECYGDPWDPSMRSQDLLPNPPAIAPELSALHEVATTVEIERKAKLAALQAKMEALQAEVAAEEEALRLQREGELTVWRDEAARVMAEARAKVVALSAQIAKGEKADMAALVVLSEAIAKLEALLESWAKTNPQSKIEEAAWENAAAKVVPEARAKVSALSVKIARVETAAELQSKAEEAARREEMAKKQQENLNLSLRNVFSQPWNESSIPRCEALVTQGANPAGILDLNRTPLHDVGSPAACAWAIAHGAVIDQQDVYGQTAAFYLVGKLKSDIFNFGFVRDPDTLNTLSTLFALGANPVSLDNTGQTARQKLQSLAFERIAHGERLASDMQVYYDRLIDLLQWFEDAHFRVHPNAKQEAVNALRVNLAVLDEKIQVEGVPGTEYYDELQRERQTLINTLAEKAAEAEEMEAMRIKAAETKAARIEAVRVEAAKVEAAKIEAAEIKAAEEQAAEERARRGWFAGLRSVFS
jgi:hypothetical protein